MMPFELLLSVSERRFPCIWKIEMSLLPALTTSNVLPSLDNTMPPWLDPVNPVAPRPPVENFPENVREPSFALSYRITWFPVESLVIM